MQDESANETRKPMIQDNSFIRPIRLPANQTRLLAGFVVLIHAGALTLLLLSALPVVGKWLGVITLFGHGGWQLQQSWPRLNPRLVRQIMLKTDDSWWWADARGHWQTAQLLPGSFIHPFMVVLRLRTVKGCRRAVIVANPANRDHLRRLCVRLRYPQTAA